MGEFPARQVHNPAFASDFSAKVLYPVWTELDYVKSKRYGPDSQRAGTTVPAIKVTPSHTSNQDSSDGGRADRPSRALIEQYIHRFTLKFEDTATKIVLSSFLSEEKVQRLHPTTRSECYCDAASIAEMAPQVRQNLVSRMS